MGRPVWQIRNTNLGTIAENIYFEYELQAIDEDLDPVSYSLIAGTLPDGIQITGTSLAGVPIRISGIPADVDVDTLSAFAIRATSTTNEVSDVTLDLTISGQKVPKITTPAGLLGSYYYGDYVDEQLDAIDEDLDNTLTWSVIEDSLPDGLVLIQDPDNDRIAYIRGYPVPITSLPAGIVPGFDEQDFDQDLDAYGFDFGIETVDKSLAFTISITDGISFDSKSYTLFLQSRQLFTADTTVITVDNDSDFPPASPSGVTADVSNKLNPILTNTEFELGTHLHDNYFTFQFTAIDFESDAIRFRAVDVNDLPGGLQIDPVTGWLYGDLALVSQTSVTYTFEVEAYKFSFPTIVSDSQEYTMTITSDLSQVLIWLTPDEITINNGEISELAIIAVTNFSSTFEVNADTFNVTADQMDITTDLDTEAQDAVIILEYSLVSGSLPPGMALTSTGLLIGRPTFSHFTLDDGATTFDGGATVIGGTTFDNSYTFTVNVLDITLGIINEDKTFTITVSPINNDPYEALYLVAKPSIIQLAYYNALISNETLIPPASVYRSGDSYFGISQDLRFLLAEGLTVSTLDEYATAMEENHYTTQFRFSDLQIAIAEDTDDNIVYEVIYANVIDKLENNGESISNELIVAGVDADDLTTRVPPAVPVYDENGSIVIHPASIENMRTRVIELITQSNPDTLPDWMTSTQTDGRVLGYIPAVPLVYCKVGTATQILFDINQSGFDLNRINFDVDRYTWDNNLTSLSIEPYFTLEDTHLNFDGLAPNGSFVGGDSVGADYAVSEDITLSNRTVITVDAIDANGDVTEFRITAIGLPFESNVTLLPAHNIEVQDETAYDGTGNNGTFTGGTGYVAADVIRLTDGTEITVDVVVAGVVTEFTVLTVGRAVPDVTLIQELYTVDSTIFRIDSVDLLADAAAQTTGIGFTLTPTLLGNMIVPGGLGFTITPIAQADMVDVGDAYLKFPFTNVFQ